MAMRIAAPDLQGEAVYGPTELYRKEIAAARLVACPGCYPTAALLALVPLVKAGLVDVRMISSSTPNPASLVPGAD